MNCGVDEIDGLLNEDRSVAPIASGAKGPAVEYLQDLLRGHGFPTLPGPDSNVYGSFGPLTANCIGAYRQRNGLAAGNRADSELLQDLVRRRAPAAVFSPAYLTLVLDLSFTPISRFVWLTSLFETRGAFALMNANTDRCGASFGILQWSQRAGQLHNLFAACYEQEPDVWRTHMGDATALEYAAKPDGGLNPAGWALNPSFELTRDPWKSKIEGLAGDPAMQRVQCRLADVTYAATLERVRRWGGPIRSERGLAFLLDLTNQFGPRRVEDHYRTFAAADPEATVMQKLEEIFTGLASPQFQAQVRARREFFRTTPLLSDQPLAL